MSNFLRRIYNSIDALIDRNALLEELQFSKEDLRAPSPQTAKQALEKVLPFIYKLDKTSNLKMIVSQQGINANGESAHWEFFFDLTQKRAQLVCDWKLVWNETVDNYTSAKIDFKITPFPPMNSPLRQMVKEGKLLHQQLIGMWKQEMNRRPNLSKTFRDTNHTIKEFAQQGLDVSQTEFSLSTQPVGGKTYWAAQTRNKTYYAEFL